MAKVINGKLVIRVGGGYMGADEFIQQYGPMEMAKVMEANGESIDLGNGKSARMSVRASKEEQKLIMNAMRDKMNAGIVGMMSEGLSVKTDDNNTNYQSAKSRKLESLSNLLKANNKGNNLDSSR
jgi:hypothetical protein